MIQLKNSLRLRFTSLTTNILKILLERGEEKVACLLIAFYEVALEDDMIFRAIENKHFQFLQFIWAFNKNLLGPRSAIDSTKITFTNLFDTIN